MVITIPTNRWYIMNYYDIFPIPSSMTIMGISKEWWPSSCMGIYPLVSSNMASWEHPPICSMVFPWQPPFIGDFPASHAWCHRRVNHVLTLAHTVKHASFWTAAAFFVFRGLAPLSASPWSPEAASDAARLDQAMSFRGLVCPKMVDIHGYPNLLQSYCGRCSGMEDGIGMELGCSILFKPLADHDFCHPQKQRNSWYHGASITWNVLKCQVCIFTLTDSLCTQCCQAAFCRLCHPFAALFLCLVRAEWGSILRIILTCQFLLVNWPGNHVKLMNTSFKVPCWLVVGILVWL